MAARLHPMFYVLLGLLALLSALIIAPFWAYVVAGLLIGYLGQPLYRRISRRIKRPGGAAGLTLAAMALVVLVPLGYIGYLLVVQARALAAGLSGDEAEDLVSGATNWTRDSFGWPADANTTVAFDLTEKAREFFLASLPSAAQYVGSFLLGLFIALFVAYYVTKEGHRLTLWIEEALPLRPHTEHHLWNEIQRSVDGVLVGSFFTAVVQGTLLGFGFFVFGIPAPVFWGFMAMILSFLPVVGPPIVWVPAVVYLVATGHPVRGIGLAIWGAVLVSGIDNVIKPKLTSVRSGMHPTVALLGAVGGLAAFGFMGFIIGPVILAIAIAMVNAYIERGRELGLEGSQPLAGSEQWPGGPSGTRPGEPPPPPGGGKDPSRRSG